MYGHVICNIMKKDHQGENKSQKEQHINKKHLHEKLRGHQGSGVGRQTHSFLYIKAKVTDKPTIVNVSLHFHSSPGLTHQTCTEDTAVKTTDCICSLQGEVNPRTINQEILGKQKLVFTF